MKGYEDFDDELILRDYLAYDRTRLALARSFLSFGRTALGLMASGLGLMIIRNEPWCFAVGIAIIGVAVVILIFGGLYCIRFKKRLDELKGK